MVFDESISDGFSHAVLWSIGVAGDLQAQGLNRRVVEELLRNLTVAGWSGLI